jgi:hypothetical protein
MQTPNKKKPNNRIEHYVVPAAVKPRLMRGVMHKVNRFITLGSKPYLIRYNSRLPIVVYVPEGVEVRYRLWTAGTETKAVEKG